jgi:hypothetical protein
MEMLDVVIPNKFVFRSKIEKCYLFPASEFGNLGLLVGLEASRPTCWGGWGVGAPRKKGSYVLHVSVSMSQRSRPSDYFAEHLSEHIQFKCYSSSLILKVVLGLCQLHGELANTDIRKQIKEPSRNLT